VSEVQSPEVMQRRGVTRSHLFACSLEFHRTLKIIARILCEVVNRERLCGHHTRGYLRCEVHVYGAVMWRGGEGGDQYCIESVLMVGDSDVYVLVLADECVHTNCVQRPVAWLPICLFVCLFVCIKPENLYFAPCVWREVITPGNGCTRNQAQTTCVTLRQRHKPRTCQSMANTLQVDGLARITGLTPAPIQRRILNHRNNHPHHAHVSS